MEDTRQSTRPLLEVEDLKTHFPVRRGILQRVVDHVRAVDGVNFKIQLDLEVHAIHRTNVIDHPLKDSASNGKVGLEVLDLEQRTC